MSRLCSRKGCLAPITNSTIPYCANCIRHIKFRHDNCKGAKLYFRGPIAICSNCNCNSSDLKLCSCVLNDDPTSEIRAHGGLITFDLCATDRRYRDVQLHYIPDDFIAKYPDADRLICPRKGNYQDCIAAHPAIDCQKIVIVCGNRIPICNDCARGNECKHCNRGYVLGTASEDHIALMACDAHFVYKCVTCQRMNVSNITDCVQCRPCDVKTNTIICCGTVHKLHSLAYPCRDVSMEWCINHNEYKGRYWQLIQTDLIQKLYKTVAASPERRRMSFATALFLRLTWQQGNYTNMSNGAIEEYTLSQYECAASALIRVRWLPQPLRLMILGYV